MTFRRIAARAACSLALPLALSAAPAWAQRTAPPPAPPVDPKVAALRDAALKDDLAYAIIEGLTTEVGQRLGAPRRKRAAAHGARRS